MSTDRATPWYDINTDAAAWSIKDVTIVFICDDHRVFVEQETNYFTHQPEHEECDLHVFVLAAAVIKLSLNY